MKNALTILLLGLAFCGCSKKPLNPVVSSNPEWTQSGIVKQGDVQVAVELYAMNAIYRTVSFHLLIKNISNDKKMEFYSWAENETPPEITDNLNNTYRFIEQDSDHILKGIRSLYPQESTSDYLTFEWPVENIRWLQLELPAKNFGGTGMIRFEIPADSKYNSSRAAAVEYARKFKGIPLP